MKHWLLMTLIGVTGCAAAPGAPGGDAAPARATATNASLSGTRWVGVVDPSIKAGNVPRLEIVAEGRLAGYTGCNLMNGTFTLEGGEARVGAIVATKRMCAGPEGDIEKRLMAALNHGKLSRQGDKLVATGPAGERFEFNPAP